MDISIIVPVYNVEKYLERCLGSIYNQKFSGIFEVIAVEDCSTDNSLNVLKEYQVNNPELIVVEHEVNKRLARARATGMKAAKGEYVMHVDSDDWLLPNALEKLYAKCKETDADVLAYNYIIVNDKEEKIYPSKIKEEIITTDKLKAQHLFFGSCWTKIVKRSLTEDMIYSTADAPKSTEDLIYCTEILLRAEKICLFPQNFYAYFNNSSSITNSTKPYGYLSNQVIILNNLDKITSRYKPNKEFQNNLLNYFEKWIYLAVCKIHFWSSKDLKITQELFEKFFEISILDSNRIKKLKVSLNNRYVSLYQVTKRFSVRYSLGVVYRSIIK